MLPDKEQKEWKDLVREDTKPSIKSFSLQMKINSVVKHYRYQLISIDEAVNELYNACERHYKLYEEDLTTIFK